uniref:AAA+ ATPase domain-containing protein n=1 Tax=Peronospora matthiolae TaxID=2874970 RepID=A0AAV1U6W5_9STRA
MTDADVYAYEQEMDEWEAAHALDMEAADEEMHALGFFEQAEAAESPETKSILVAVDQLPLNRNNDTTESANDVVIATESRLDQLLARCETFLGEDGDRDVVQVSRVKKDVELSTKRTSVPSLDTAAATYLYSRPPVDVDSLSVVLSDGKRLFVRKKRPRTTTSTSFDAIRTTTTSLVPVKEMMEAVERMEISEAALKEEEALLQEHNVVYKDSVNMTNAVLWLDKYRPQSFLDLLSDERTNREVLTWIKSWDQYVFPKKERVNSTSSATATTNAYGNSSTTSWNHAAANTHASGSTGVEDEEDKRPFHKIILICGPPGAGKTTLANIVAHHAGYNPLEVNASDDRTASVLRNKIISAMEMQSIWGECKPNCIILDEIDGAMNGSDGKSAIEVIQEIVNAPLAKKKTGAKMLAKNRHPLTRPLICVCNDLYASVLRPLRRIAKIFTLDAPHPQRLVTRLKHICRHEGIKASTGALANLCSSAGNDIRFCLNTLQFQSTQSREAAANKSAPVVAFSCSLLAQKDHAHGMFEALNLVFYEARSTSAKGQIPAIEKIIAAVSSLGNSSLLLNGLDENVPKMIFNDPTMSKICDVFEWLGLADEYENRAHSEQQHVFQAYIPFAAIATHASCCTSSRRRVEYPRAQFEAKKRSDHAENILGALVEGALLQPILRLSHDDLVVDLVPWLLAILSPGLRRTNPSLQTKEEKVMTHRLIQLMTSLGLSFQHKYLPDGSEDYALEPPLNELVEFRSDETNAAYRFVLPLPVRKMIAREVNLEQMRRNESTASTRRHGNSNSVSKMTHVPSEATIEEKAAKITYALPELSDIEQAKKDEALRKRNPFAFAHREAKRKRDEESDAKLKRQHTAAAHVHSMVRYKYNEGYTCGIKTTVYVRDLL